MLWVPGITIDRDPDDIDDWDFDWTTWLGADTIASYDITVQAGMTNNGDSIDGSIINVSLSGGVVGSTYTVSCKIVTAGGRTKERSARFRIQQQ